MLDHSLLLSLLVYSRARRAHDHATDIDSPLSERILKKTPRKLQSVAQIMYGQGKQAAVLRSFHEWNCKRVRATACTTVQKSVLAPDDMHIESRYLADTTNMLLWVFI